MTKFTATSIPICWNSALPVYASEAFLRTVGDEYGWIGGRDESGQVRCFLPYVEIRKIRLRIVRFQTEVVPVGQELSLEEERAFLNATVDYLRTTGCDIIMPGTNASLFQTFPEGATAAPYGTFLKDLRKSEDDLLKEIHSTFRYNIRRAGREGVEIKEGLQYLDKAYELTAETLERSHQPFKSHKDFKESILALGEHVKILVAEANGVCQGAMVAPFSEYAAYTWYCGSRPEPVLGSTHLLHWEAMLRFRNLGVRRFNFQGVRINPEKGSKQEGIMNFKSRFGGALVQGYTWKYGFGRLSFAAYGAAMRLMKGGDIVDAEHHKLETSPQ
jgi:lipid II:glycine glycyltransferase (peptidoglycan interpeptide bridge formation enzyme)